LPLGPLRLHPHTLFDIWLLDRLPPLPAAARRIGDTIDTRGGRRRGGDLRAAIGSKLLFWLQNPPRRSRTGTISRSSSAAR
jgi:hypothetical protein